MAAEVARQAFLAEQQQRMAAATPQPSASYKAVAYVIEPIETFFNTIGLTSPGLRLAGVFGLGAAALWFIKPTLFFYPIQTEDGKVQYRPKSMAAADKAGAAKSPEKYVAVPWWGAALLLGLAAGLFV